MTDSDIPSTSAVYKCAVSRGQAIDAVRHWWGDRLMAEDLEKKSRFVRCELRYVPFWELKASFLGSVTGYRLEGDDVSDTKIPMREVVNTFFIWGMAACDTRDIGVDILRDLTGEAEQCDPSHEGLPALSVLKSDALVALSIAMEKKVLKDAGVPHITSKDFEVRHVSDHLILFPLWVVRYTYRGRQYHATINGVTGNLLAGQAKGDLALRCIAFVACIAASVTFSLFSLAILGWMVSIDCNSGLAAIFLIFILLFGFYILIVIMKAMSYSFFGSKVTVGTYTHGHKPLGQKRNKRGLAANAHIILFSIALMAIGWLLFLTFGMTLPSAIFVTLGLIVFSASCRFDSGPLLPDTDNG